MELIIVTGMSGAGKTQAMHCLEDLGYYCVDNMPPRLMKDFINLAESGADKIEKAAFVVDTRGGRFFRDMVKDLDSLELGGTSYSVMFLDASDAALIRRYKETRRIHPLSPDGSIAEGIAKERKLLESIKKRASIVIDTTSLKTSGLYSEIRKILLSDKPECFNISVMSFGYKYGIPAEADFVFDTRFLPNPFYVPNLKNLTGNNKKVRSYVMKSKESSSYMHCIVGMMETVIPGFIREGKYNLVLAVGCTGGQHRSVSIANELADTFRSLGRNVRVTHRDL